MTKDFFISIFGEKSHLNLAGKCFAVLMLPWAIALTITWDVLDFMFTKRPKV